MSDEIHNLLAHYVHAPVECDGFIRLVHTALVNAGIEHFCYLGRLESRVSKLEIPIHFWISLPDGRIIDYKARMWIGEVETVPHGIFDEAKFPDWAYLGERIEIPTLNPSVVAFLMAPIPSTD